MNPKTSILIQKCRPYTKTLVLGTVKMRFYTVEMFQVGEVGELSEIFQWRGDSVARGLPGFSSEDKRHVGEEMSDVSYRHLHMHADLSTASISMVAT